MWCPASCPRFTALEPVNHGLKPLKPQVTISLSSCNSLFSRICHRDMKLTCSSLS
jgi:hypothetical protein